MNVITADYGSSTKVVTVLEDSVDYVEWCNEWLNDQSLGMPGPYEIRSTLVADFGALQNVGGAMVHPVAYEMGRKVLVQ